MTRTDGARRGEPHRVRTRVPSPVIRPGEIVAVICGSLLLASSWLIVAWQNRVPGWEADLFRHTNDLADWLWPVVRLPMQLGGLPGSLVVVAATYVVSRDRRLTLAALVARQAAYWLSKG